MQSKGNPQIPLFPLFIIKTQQNTIYFFHKTNILGSKKDEQDYFQNSFI